MVEQAGGNGELLAHHAEAAHDVGTHAGAAARLERHAGRQVDHRGQHVAARHLDGHAPDLEPRTEELRRVAQIRFDAEHAPRHDGDAAAERGARGIADGIRERRRRRPAEVAAYERREDDVGTRRRRDEDRGREGRRDEG